MKRLLLLTTIALTSCAPSSISVEGVTVGYVQNRGVVGAQAVALASLPCPRDHQIAVAWVAPNSRGGVMCVDVNPSRIEELTP